MKKGLRHIRRAFLMGLAWAIAWAPVAILIGLIVDPDESMDEMWFVIGAYPGFLCAVIFCAVLAIAARGVRLDELSLARAGALGAVSGLFVGALPFALGTPNPALPLWQLAGSVIGSITLASMISAVTSVLVARTANKRELRPAS